MRKCSVSAKVTKAVLISIQRMIKRADEVGGGDAVGRAVVQVDHHQEEGEQKGQSAKRKEVHTQCTQIIGLDSVR